MPTSQQLDRDAFQNDEPGAYVYAVTGEDVWRFDHEDDAVRFMHEWDLHGTHEWTLIYVPLAA